MKLLDFEGKESGFKELVISKQNIKNNIGKKICYVDYIEPYRGTYFVRYGIIYGIKYSRILLSEDGGTDVDIRKIKQMGIEI